jgi:hypothetical protein
MTFGNPDFASYARAHHAKGSEIETADVAIKGRAKRFARIAGGPCRLPQN